MLGSRTIKTLTALVAAMTVGAIGLLALETAPIRPAGHNLAAVSNPADTHAKAVLDTDVPIQPIKWRNIVIHSSGPRGRDVARRCHFVIEAKASDDGQYVGATILWKRQGSGNHVFVPGRDFNADSIGICLMGDFSSKAPGSGQFQALVKLVQALQQRCNVSADHVYLHSQLDAHSRSPGDAFPSETFASHLLRPGR